MRSFSFAVCLIVGGIALFASAPAFAVCNPSTTTEVSCLKAADKSCAQLGTSMMDKDQKTIIACLRNDSGTLEWKAMTSGSAPTLLSRQVTCAAAFLPGYADTMGCTASCASDEVVTGGGAGWGGVYSQSGRVLRKDENGFRCYINKEACSGGGDTCNAECYAICTKIVP